MNATVIRPRWSKRTRCSGFVALAVLGAVAGCPVPPDDGNGDNGGSNGTETPTAEILNIPASGVPVELLGVEISVLYSVEGTVDSVAGFYQPVSDNDSTAMAVGDRVIVATNLPAVTDGEFKFDPQAAGVGFFKVGILVSFGAAEEVFNSAGVIQVQGPPAPVFVQPAEDIKTVVRGEDDPVVGVTFDAGDPEGDVQWRVFFLSPKDSRDLPPDQLGSQIQVGSGNAGVVTFDTTGLLADDYELGVSATDSGLSISGTVGSGALDRIVTVFGPIVRIE